MRAETNLVILRQCSSPLQRMERILKQQSISDKIKHTKLIGIIQECLRLLFRKLKILSRILCRR